MSRVAVHTIRGEADREAARALAWEFFDDTRARFPEMAALIETYIRDHAIAEELAAFEAHFEPPHGQCFLAHVDGVPMGIVKLRPHDDGGGELNRMYVREAARGLGCGRLLVAALVETARHYGYRYIYLNSLRQMTGAHALYEKQGFRFIPPDGGYRAEDDDIIHMRLDLGQGAA